MQLLEKGYTVRGTVRSTKDAAKTEVLHALAAALPGNLELHEADLLTEGSFDSVVKGATYVFHTASPFFREADDPQTELVGSTLLADHTCDCMPHHWRSSRVCKNA